MGAQRLHMEGSTLQAKLLVPPTDRTHPRLGPAGALLGPPMGGHSLQEEISGDRLLGHHTGGTDSPRGVTTASILQQVTSLQV